MMNFKYIFGEVDILITIRCKKKEPPRLLGGFYFIL